MKNRHQRRQERRQQKQARAAEKSSPLHNAAALFQSGKAGQAAEILEKLLTVQPNNFDALVLLGVIRAKTGNPGAAIPLFESALEINPGNAGVHSNLGNVLQALGRLDNAVASHRRALQIDPSSAMLHSNLGNALRVQGLFDDAVASHKRALEINPNIASIHNNLGYALEQQGLLNDAVANFKKAITIKPEYAEAHNNLGSAFHNLGKSDEAVASYRKALAIQPDFARAQSNLINALNYITDSPSADMLAEARRFGTMVAANVTPYSEHSNDPDPNRRLRVGLISGDFGIHSVSFFLDAVLSEIDAEKLELFAYATSTRDDEMTTRISKNMSHWRKAAWMDDVTLAAKIIADRIDILVDLSGHTTLHRLDVFARKPAPIQVTWLGYSATTGVDAVDYILCDKWVLPPEGEEHFVEKPWRLPDSYLCFSPPDLKMDVAALPARANSFITFGCFNNLIKMTDSVVSCWAEILHGVPNSRLFLKAKQLSNASVQKDVLSRFSSHGVSPELLCLKGRSPDRSTHFASYNQVDISLDPFPYAGTTTSFEALWMGTPLLTLHGDRFISRVGESILQNVGLAEWIGATPQDYIEKAIANASDLQALSTLREGLRERLTASCVCDAPRFARNFEDAFQGMWEEWCKKSHIMR